MSVSTAVDSSAVARTVGLKTTFKNLRGGSLVSLPQRIAVVGQGASAATYAADKVQVLSAFQAGETYGFGSPVHLAVKQLLPDNGDGVGSIPVTVYPMSDHGSGVAAAGDITPSGTQTEAASYRVSVNNILSEVFTISAGDSVATIVAAMATAINANLDMPVIAADNTTDLTITAKWQGVSGNDISLSVIGSTTAGTTFAFTQPVGGLNNPDVTDRLALIGDVWETLVVNLLDAADTAALAAFGAEGESRWGAAVRKPLVVLTGLVPANVAAAIAVPETRKLDRTNCFISAPDCDELPFVLAARAACRIARVAEEDAAHDYGSQPLTGLTPGSDENQWTYLEKDAAVKGGCSTSRAEDGVILLSDTVTFFHPSGDATPAYRFVCDVIKLMNIIYNLDAIFTRPDWDGAPLIPDDQPTSNRNAKKPRTAKAEVAGLVDELARVALISDPETAKKSILAEIDSSNPKRLNIALTVQLSGNTNIISIDFNFGFYFGTTTNLR